MNTITIFKKLFKFIIIWSIYLYKTLFWVAMECKVIPSSGLQKSGKTPRLCRRFYMTFLRPQRWNYLIIYFIATHKRVFFSLIICCFPCVQRRHIENFQIYIALKMVSETKSTELFLFESKLFIRHTNICDFDVLFNYYIQPVLLNINWQTSISIVLTIV